MLIGIPTDSTALSETQLIPAVPYAIGVPADALKMDSAGEFHIDPRVRHHLGHDSLAVLRLPAKLELDTKIHGCGSMNCDISYPVYTFLLRSGSIDMRVFIESIPGEGVLVEETGGGR